jgi:3-methyl-2-oxobutanoate hydroxymethyltransferase
MSAAQPVTVRDLAAMRDRGERIVMVPAYDARAAALADEAGIPVLLVGDSLAMVVLGHPTTLPVTLDEMLHHARAVVRGAGRALVVVDLPFGSTQGGPADALASGIRVLKETGAAAVKLEGGRGVAPSVRALTEAGVPVMGHVGLTPQSVHALGGYRVQGRGDGAAEALVADVTALAAAGAFAVVLEAVPAPVAAAVTAAAPIPVIGIGAGPDVDGQVLVWHDVLGLSPGPHPRFVRAYDDLRGRTVAALRAFADDVASGGYPVAEETYGS